MAKSRVQTRVEPDTKEQIDKYAEEREIGDSEAVRRLIRSGLAAEGHPVIFADGGTPLERLASPNNIIIGLLGLFVTSICYISFWFLNSAGDTIPALVVGILGVFTTVLTAGIMLGAVLAQIALARPLRDLVLDVKEAPSNE